MPLSLTIIFGLPFGDKPAEFTGDPMPEIEVSGMSTRQSWLQSSTNREAHAAAVDELVGYEVDRPHSFGS